jgi:hypothetical protein
LENNTGVIYLTTNLINDKKYIGLDSYNKPNYLGGGTALKRAIRKYGKENFKKEILEYCDKENLEKREIYWISYYNAVEDPSFYNISYGGKLGDHKYRIIECYDLDGNYLQTYNSTLEAISVLNLKIKPHSITNCINNKCKSIGGFQWKNKDTSKEIKKYHRLSNSKKPIVNIYRYNKDGKLLDKWNDIKHVCKEIGFSYNQVFNSIKYNKYCFLNKEPYYFSSNNNNLIAPLKNASGRKPNKINVIDLNSNIIFSGLIYEIIEYFNIKKHIVYCNLNKNTVYNNKQYGKLQFRSIN